MSLKLNSYITSKDKLSEDYKVYGIESIDSDKFDRQKRIIGWDQYKITNSTVCNL